MMLHSETGFGNSLTSIISDSNLKTDFVLYSTVTEIVPESCLNICFAAVVGISGGKEKYPTTTHKQVEPCHPKNTCTTTV